MTTEVDDPRRTTAMTDECGPKCWLCHGAGTLPLHGEDVPCVECEDAVTYHRIAMDKADEADRLREALRPFASMRSNNGVDCCAGYPDEVIIRIEASVGEIRRARAALNYKELIA